MMHAPERSRERAGRLGARLDELAVGALLLTHAADIRWVSGFAGSAGAVLVRRDGTWALATDDRYADAVRREAPDAQLVVTRTPYTDLVSAVDPGPVGVIGDDVTLTQWNALAAAVGESGVVAVDDIVACERASKDADEVAAIAAACRITDAAFSDVLTLLKPGVEERDVARTLVNLMLDHGADDVAFPPIVAAGPNAAVPHHSPGGRMLAPGDLVVIDMGASVEGYCADMTRTVAIGRVSEQLRELYEAVDAAAAAARSVARAGVPVGTVHDTAVDVLRQAGLADAVRHGTGHGVGLEIHEPPILRSGGDATLGTSFTVTIEPGAYIPGLGGVRIEDLVLVGASGVEPLTHQPRSLITL